ncbi:MAG: UvrB/UvrC motif-containing protein [Deferribacteres bacterium]|nr:UvrB/UvrC motif-containing protein [candidate division KSB1 bacterium]MCB9504187.1 UvrB/UvrC motif-containing protein [Deferribacteres bacterium]
MSEKKRCQICEMHQATMKVKAMRNGEEVELHICNDCARFKGLITDEKATESELATFFKKASMNILGTDPEKETKKFAELECSTCGLTFNDFQKDGLFGCSNCYETFQEELEPLLRRIHGSSKHIGSRPRPLRVIANEPDMAALKRELHTAISQENYERAADFRDLIRDLEREQNND